MKKNVGLSIVLIVSLLFAILALSARLALNLIMLVEAGQVVECVIICVIAVIVIGLALLLTIKRFQQKE